MSIRPELEKGFIVRKKKIKLVDVGELCVRPTCAAYVIYGMIQKASKGDTSAAKFLCELAKEKPEENKEENLVLENVSDAVLM